jgi:hypothetical protein
VIPHNKKGCTKSNICQFDSGKWFWLSIFAQVSVAGKRLSSAVHLKIKCNKYDLTAAQCFWLAHHNDWSRWFVINSAPPICCPSFSFVAGVAKEYITKLGCEKYFLRVTYWAPLGDALRKVTISPSIIGVCSQLSQCRIPVDGEWHGSCQCSVGRFSDLSRFRSKVFWLEVPIFLGIALGTETRN